MRVCVIDQGLQMPMQMCGTIGRVLLSGRYLAGSEAPRG